MKSMKINKIRILDAALVLLESEGIEGLTMRKLADTLHIRAASLYWHFSNKQSLIEGIADHMVKDVATHPPETNSWQQTTEHLASELREALMAHRDGARVFAGTYVISDNILRINNALISAFSQSGAPLSAAAEATMTVLYFVLGCCIEQQAAVQAGSDYLAEKRMVFDQTDHECYPQTQAAADILFNTDFDSRFRNGLDMLLSGFRQKIS